MKWLVRALLLIVVFGLIGTFVVPRPTPTGDAPVPTTSSTTTSGIPSNLQEFKVTANGLDALGLPVSHSRTLQTLHKTHFSIGYDNERRDRSRRLVIERLKIPATIK
jgi:hypothetical protein